MSLFKLYKDVKYASWDRLYYEVEAETIEDAVKKIVDGDVEEYDIEALDEYTTLSPEENNGRATIEIYNDKYERLYQNGK